MGSNVGLVSYGTFIPRYRIGVEEILRVWNNFFAEILKEQLMVSERVVLSPDQDTLTLAFEAARQALGRVDLPDEALGGVYLGTCTSPWDTRPAATALAEMLGLTGFRSCSDLQFSTKSGTAALQMAWAMVASGALENALAVGSDVLNRHVAPGTLQEYSASSAAAAFVVGRDPARVIAEIAPFTSFVSDLSDTFRVSGERYIRSGGLSALESGIGFLEHIGHAVRAHLKRDGLDLKQFDYAVFQQPVGVVPVALALQFGMGMDQVTPGLVAYELGDLGSASVGVGLATILDQAEPGQKILLASYGSGAGADVTVLTVTENITGYRRAGLAVEDQIQDKEMVDYATAMKYEGKYAKVEHALTAWL